MKSSREVFFTVSFAFFVTCLSVWCSHKFWGPYAGPRVFCKNGKVELVGVAGQESVDVRFVIENVGREPLVISDVRVGCPTCVEVAPFDKKPLPPTCARVLNVRLLPASIGSKQTKVIALLSNDPYQPRYTLKIVVTP